MFHVAITRGIGRVVVLADASRPSPFLAELDRDATPAELTAAPAAAVAAAPDGGAPPPPAGRPRPGPG